MVLQIVMKTKMSNGVLSVVLFISMDDEKNTQHEAQRRWMTYVQVSDAGSF